MAVIVHDPRPDRSDHLAAEIGDQAVIILRGTEIIRVRPQFRFLNDIPRRRFRSFWYEDCFIQEVLQQIGFTLAKTTDNIFLVLFARHVGNMCVSHPAQHLKQLFTDSLRLIVIAATNYFQCFRCPDISVRLVVEVLLEFLIFFFFQLLNIYILYDSGIGIAFNASSILIACTGTYSPLSRTLPPVNVNNSLDVFKSSRRFSFESN